MDTEHNLSKYFLEEPLDWSFYPEGDPKWLQLHLSQLGLPGSRYWSRLRNARCLSGFHIHERNQEEVELGKWRINFKQIQQILCEFEVGSIANIVCLWLTLDPNWLILLPYLVVRYGCPSEGITRLFSIAQSTLKEVTVGGCFRLHSDSWTKSPSSKEISMSLGRPQVSVLSVGDQDVDHSSWLEFGLTLAVASIGDWTRMKDISTKFCLSLTLLFKHICKLINETCK